VRDGARPSEVVPHQHPEHTERPRERNSGSIIDAIIYQEPASLESFTLSLSDGTPQVRLSPSAVIVPCALDEERGVWDGGGVPASAPGATAAAAHRRERQALRSRAVAFRVFTRELGCTLPATAKLLDLSPRTLSYWCCHAQTGALQPDTPGPPPRRAPAERRAAVADCLLAHGPSLSLAALRAAFPDLTRAELRNLRSDFRADWCAAHAVERCDLEWLRPGSVWAMDYTHPPHLIDGCFGSILNVRDLASHQQLLWLPLAREDAATLVDVLVSLFEAHGAPLVLKCDNGPAFRAAATKKLLRAWSVFGLYSPPYCPGYNGACERANRTLKELTEHLADQDGRPGFWRSEDLLTARLDANRLSRPWGPCGASPEECWANRCGFSLDERATVWQELESGIVVARQQRGIDPAAALPHYTQTEIERLAAQPVLETLGLLHVRRRRVTPVI
jgi:transposase InsO family protein